MLSGPIGPLPYSVRCLFWPYGFAAAVLIFTLLMLGVCCVVSTYTSSACALYPVSMSKRGITCILICVAEIKDAIQILLMSVTMPSLHRRVQPASFVDCCTVLLQILSAGLCYSATTL